jgi:hypothetical protein
MRQFDETPCVTGAMRGLANRGRDWLHDQRRVMRFLRERRSFIARPDDVFISSYPRSGTTWLQHIAHVLVRDGDSGFRHISDVVPWFERTLALGQRRACDFEDIPGPRLFKSHLPFSWLPRGARYLYVVRDGRDVAVSYYHFYRSHLGFEGTFPEFLARFLVGRLQYRSWFRHVNGWLAHAGSPVVHIVFYERLLHDLPAVLSEIAHFCGVTRSRERISQLEALCRFEYMKCNEGRFDHATASGAAPYAGSGAFIREGRQGSYQRWFTTEQLRRFRAHARRHRPCSRVEFRLADFLH